MKECPGCGSIGPDEESKCGVCGHDLLAVEPLTKTLGEEELETESKRRAENRLEEKTLARQLQKHAILSALIGGSVGLAILAFSFTYFTVWSIFFIPLGLLVLATGFTGGLGRGGLQTRQYWMFKLLFPRAETRTERELREREAATEDED